MNTVQLRYQVNELIESGGYGEIKSLLTAYKEITERDNGLATVCYLCTIYEQEKAAGQTVIFSKVSDMDSLLDRYTVLKFYLRRIEFDVMENMEEFYTFLTQHLVSSYELLRTIDFSVVHKEKVLRAINSGVNDKENDPSDKTENIDMQDESKDMQEFCFIICTNNQMYAQECIYYIEHLTVPEKIRTDILTVTKADSLTSAYNEAMRYSSAKYKVYLHHDTFIINPDFIKDCLRIFESNPQVGMLGNIGVRSMPDSGVMWDADRYGMLYEQHIYETELLANTFGQNLPYLEVDAIDGFLMVTQYDICWRDDLFKKWDFYDCSQSMEFIRRGYQVVVPYMERPWCVHDCGFINLTNYEEERKKFVKEYLSREQGKER